MRQKTYRTAGEMQRLGPADALREVRRFGGFATTEAAERFKDYAERLSPIGGIMSKARRNRAPGLLQKSWQMVGGGQSQGRVYALGNRAPHAGIINMGRRRNKRAYRVRKSGRFFRGGATYTIPANHRFLGSRLAPRGVVRPTWKRLKLDEAAVSAIAIRKAEAGSGA